MICSIHQPQSFPWLGYFSKIMASDIFIILDNVQYKKNEFQNRNKIKYNEEAHWLTIPVKHKFGQKINEIEINNNIIWRRKILNSLQTYYAKSPYFHQFFPSLSELINKEYKLLSEFNINFILWILKLLKTDTQIVISSNIYDTKELNKLPASEKLIKLINKVEASIYLSGSGGKEYLNEEIFKKNEINIMYQNYFHPVYSQIGEKFVSNLSILDLLFNEGNKSRNIILKGNELV